MANPTALEQKRDAFLEDVAPITAPLVVEQQKLEPRMQDYVMELAKRSPFTHDLRTEHRSVISALANFWPELPDWKTEAEGLWKAIDGFAASVPTTAENPELLLRISAARKKLAPTVMPENEEPSFVASFDGVEGVMRSCSVPANEQAMSLSDMEIPAGVMVTYQAAPAGNTDIMHERPFDSGSATAEGDSLYGERNRDRVLKGGDLPHQKSLRELAALDVYPRPYSGLEPHEQMMVDNADRSRLAFLISQGLVGGGLEKKARVGGATALATVAGAGLALRHAQQERRANVAHERRADGHERRAGAHERRRPGRPGRYDINDIVGGDGLTNYQRDTRAKEGVAAAIAADQRRAFDTGTRQQAQAAAILAQQQRQAAAQQAPQRPEAHAVNETIALTPEGTVETSVPTTVEQALTNPVPGQAMTATDAYIDPALGGVVAGEAGNQVLSGAPIPGAVIDPVTGAILAGAPVEGVGIAPGFDNAIASAALPENQATPEQALLEEAQGGPAPAQADGAPAQQGQTQQEQAFAAENRNAPDNAPRDVRDETDVTRDAEGNVVSAGFSRQYEQRQESLGRAADNRRNEADDRRETLQNREQRTQRIQRTDDRADRRADDQRHERDLDRDREQRQEQRSENAQATPAPVGVNQNRTGREYADNRVGGQDPYRADAERHYQEKVRREADKQNSSGEELIKEFVKEAAIEDGPSAKHIGDILANAAVASKDAAASIAGGLAALDMKATATKAAIEEKVATAEGEKRRVEQQADDAQAAQKKKDKDHKTGLKGPTSSV